MYKQGELKQHGDKSKKVKHVRRRIFSWKSKVPPKNVARFERRSGLAPLEKDMVHFAVRFPL